LSYRELDQQYRLCQADLTKAKAALAQAHTRRDDLESELAVARLEADDYKQWMEKHVQAERERHDAEKEQLEQKMRSAIQFEQGKLVEVQERLNSMTQELMRYDELVNTAQTERDECRKELAEVKIAHTEEVHQLEDELDAARKPKFVQAAAAGAGDMHCPGTPPGSPPAAGRGAGAAADSSRAREAFWNGLKEKESSAGAGGSSSSSSSSASSTAMLEKAVNDWRQGYHQKKRELKELQASNAQLKGEEERWKEKNREALAELREHEQQRTNEWRRLQAHFEKMSYQKEVYRSKLLALHAQNEALHANLQQSHAALDAARAPQLSSSKRSPMSSSGAKNQVDEEVSGASATSPDEDGPFGPKAYDQRDATVMAGARREQAGGSAGSTSSSASSGRAGMQPRGPEHDVDMQVSAHASDPAAEREQFLGNNPLVSAQNKKVKNADSGGGLIYPGQGVAALAGAGGGHDSAREQRAATASSRFAGAEAVGGAASVDSSGLEQAIRNMKFWRPGTLK